MTKIRLSVIIPLAPEEPERLALQRDLSLLPKDTEVLWVRSNVTAFPLPKIGTRLTVKGFGRANHMNAGAAKAQGQYLWFLHADSSFNAGSVLAIQAFLAQPATNNLKYFDLAFHPPRRGVNKLSLMQLNAWGANIRSRLLKVPFGDQGFLLSKSLFEKLGGYPADLAYGEDHVFVWRARQQGIRVQPIGATLVTSPRKYQQQGWLKITCLHQYRWLKQALPEFYKLLKHKAR